MCIVVWKSVLSLQKIISYCCLWKCFFFWHNSPTHARAVLCSRFLDYTQLHTTVGRTPLDWGSARLRDLYLRTHNTYNRQTSMPPAGFKPAIPVGERPQTFVLDRSATGIGAYGSSYCPLREWCVSCERMQRY